MGRAGQFRATVPAGGSIDLTLAVVPPPRRLPEATRLRRCSVRCPYGDGLSGGTSIGAAADFQESRAGCLEPVQEPAEAKPKEQPKEQTKDEMFAPDRLHKDYRLSVSAMRVSSED